MVLSSDTTNPGWGGKGVVILQANYFRLDIGSNSLDFRLMFSILYGNSPLKCLTLWQPLSHPGGDWAPNKSSAFSMLILLVWSHSSAGSCLAGSSLDFLPVPAFSIAAWLGQKSPSALTAMKWGSCWRGWKLKCPLLSLYVSKNSANNCSKSND